MAKERRHYPFIIYILTVLCALGLASIALAIADGWVVIAAGAVATTVSLGRLHVILQLRQAEVGPRPFPLERASLAKDGL